MTFFFFLCLPMTHKPRPSVFPFCPHLEKLIRMPRCSFCCQRGVQTVKALDRRCNPHPSPQPNHHKCSNTISSPLTGPPLLRQHTLNPLQKGLYGLEVAARCAKGAWAHPPALDHERDTLLQKAFLPKSYPE